MKKIFLICISVLVLFTSCRKTPQASIQTGDLVFVALPSDYHLYNRDYVVRDHDYPVSDDKPESYEDLIIHTAIADVDKDGVWIIDATLAHGVDRHPLDVLFSDFALKNGYSCDYIVMRLKNNKDAKRYVANARHQVGKSYNLNFTPCDTALYCTELVRNSYLDKKGNPIFPEAPMDFRNRENIIPDYWTWLFGLLGKEVPQGVMGTLPQSMIEDSHLYRVDCQLTEYGNLAFDERPVETYFDAIDEYLVKEIGQHYPEAEAYIPFHSYIAVDESDPEDIKVWGDFWLLNYNQSGDTLKVASGGNHPGLMHVRQIGDTHFEVTSFEPVGDGSNFTPSAKKIFGDKYEAFSTALADDQKREAIRKASVEEYVHRHNLPIHYYQDYGWPAVKITNN